MKHKFYVYKVIAETEVIVTNEITKEEARKFVMKNAKHLNYKRPDYFYMLLNKKPKETL